MDKNLKGDRGGKSEGRNRVGWDLAADSAGRRVHISVADADFLPVHLSGFSRVRWSGKMPVSQV